MAVSGNWKCGAICLAVCACMVMPGLYLSIADGGSQSAVQGLVLPATPNGTKMPLLPSLDVPLTVTDTAPGGLARAGEHVTSGIPLPESASITDSQTLQVTDSGGSAVPAQFTVISRYNGTVGQSSKPIKWVLLDFAATVPAGGSAVYHLKNGGTGNATATELSLQDNANDFTVSNGKVKYVVSKQHFNLFDYVYIDRDGDGQVDDAIVSQPAENGLELVNSTGAKYTAMLEAPEEISVEMNGPMRIAIKVRGVLKEAGGQYFCPSCHNDYPGKPYFWQPYDHSFFYFQCRYYFYAGQDMARVFFTIENNGANGMDNPEWQYATNQMAYFDSISLSLKLAGIAGPAARVDGVSATVSGADTFALSQDWHENLTDDTVDTLETVYDNGPYWKTYKNNGETASGFSNPGWMDINDGTSGAGFAMRDFWQNFPKKVVGMENKLGIDLWPASGYYPFAAQANFTDSSYDKYVKYAGYTPNLYLLDAGRHKTHEMAFSFYKGSSDGTATQSLSKALDNPLVALASPEWYAGSGAIDWTGPGGMTSTDPIINETFSMWERLQRAMVITADSDNGFTIHTVKTKNPPWYFQWAQDRFFGWANWGDLCWNSQFYCSLHYDWTYGMLMHYLRTGNRAFFDAAESMAKHRYDLDQYHGDRVDTEDHHELYINHIGFYETDGHANPAVQSFYTTHVGFNSHTWNGGLCLYYLLTGDVKSYEAALENGQSALGWFGTGGLASADVPGCTSEETRWDSWPMMNLLNLYGVDGNPEFLRVAKNIAKNRLMERERLAGSQGVLGTVSMTDTSPGSNYVLCTQHNYLLGPMIKVHMATQDPAIGACVLRIANFTKDKYLYGGDTDGGGNYRPHFTTYYYNKSDPNGAINGGQVTGTNSFYADLFAYAYMMTGQAEYLQLARACFKDDAFYYMASPATYIDPDWRSVVSYYDTMYPGSETKQHGWMIRNCHIYLYMEWKLGAGVPLQVVGQSLADCVINAPATRALTAVGGIAPYTWSVDSGSLPPGMALNASTGAISGTPTALGTYNFTVRVNDSAGSPATDTGDFSITVVEEPVVPEGVWAAAVAMMAGTVAVISAAGVRRKR